MSAPILTAEQPKVVQPSHNDVIDMINNLILQAEGHSECNAKAELGLGCKYEHSFADGLYIRKMFLPKDTVFVTKVHKTKHPYFIMVGDVTVYNDNQITHIKAPYSGITERGTRRALRTHEDTIWITIHVTEKTDIEEIVNDISSHTVKEYELWQKQITDSGGIL